MQTKVTTMKVKALRLVRACFGQRETPKRRKTVASSEQFACVHFVNRPIPRLREHKRI